MKKKLLALLLAATMLVSFIPAASAAYSGEISMTINSETMTVNGYPTTIDSEGSRAVLYSDYTMLPIRALVEAMGGSVSWNETTRQITMTYKSDTVVLTLGEKTAYVNGEAQAMSVAPFTDRGRTYVWLRTVEFFDGVSVTWNAATQTATVNYTSDTAFGQPLTFTLANGTYNALQSIALAPTGTGTYSANIMTSGTQLYSGQTGSYSIAITPGYYDLCVTDAYGNTYYYTKLNLTEATSLATVSLTGNASYSLSIDGQPAYADATANLVLYNRTGSSIMQVSYAPTSTWTWTSLTASYISDSSSGTVSIPYSSAAPYYDLMVTFTDGSTEMYSRINLAYYSNSVLVTLKDDGAYAYGNSYDEVKIKFENDSGEKIEELYFASSSSSSAFDDADDVLSSNLKDGDSSYVYADLSGKTTWYVRAYYDDGDEYFKDSIKIDSDVTSFTLSLDDDGEFEVSNQDTDDDDDDDDDDTDFEIVVINTTGDDIEHIVFLDRDDMDDIEDDDDDLEEIEDDYDIYDDGDVEDGEMKVFEVELDSSEKVGMMIFWDSADDNDEPDEFITLKFDSSVDDYGLVVIYDRDEDGYDVYDDDGLDSDERYVVVYNASDADLDEGDFQISEHDDDDFETFLDSDISEGSYDVFIVDDDDWSDFDIAYQGDDDDIIIKDKDWEDNDFVLYFYYVSDSKAYYDSH